MMCVRRTLADGSSKIYRYDTVCGKDINTYMRDRLAAERSHRIIHVSDIPNTIRDEILRLRDEERLSWHAIAARVQLSSYLVKKSYRAN